MERAGELEASDVGPQVAGDANFSHCYADDSRVLIGAQYDTGGHSYAEAEPRIPRPRGRDNRPDTGPGGEAEGGEPDARTRGKSQVLGT